MGLKGHLSTRVSATPLAPYADVYAGQSAQSLVITIVAAEAAASVSSYNNSMPIVHNTQP